MKVIYCLVFVNKLLFLKFRCGYDNTYYLGTSHQSRKMKTPKKCNNHEAQMIIFYKIFEVYVIVLEMLSQS